MSDPTTEAPAPPSIPPGVPQEDDSPPCPDPNASPDDQPLYVPGFDPREWAERQQQLREQAAMQGQVPVDAFGLEPPGNFYEDEITSAIMSRFHLEVRNERAQKRIAYLQNLTGAQRAELERLYKTYEPHRLPPEISKNTSGAEDNSAQPNSKSGNISDISERSNGRHEPGTKA